MPTFSCPTAVTSITASCALTPTVLVSFSYATGWRAHGPIRYMLSTHPSPGLVQSEHHIFRADDATYIGPPEDSHESDRVEWVPLAEIRPLISKQEITAGTTLVALLHVLSDS
ncbi:hypothetical protein [Cryptosporangium sp. NPDC048952]|uniref:hypothetical protein n=1 Tax=Cryptosporangium sp. NPDC048952 TaxID=3363961 RepID=UPI00371831B9